MKNNTTEQPVKSSCLGQGFLLGTWKFQFRQQPFHLSIKLRIISIRVCNHPLPVNRGVYSVFDQSTFHEMETNKYLYFFTFYKIDLQLKREATTVPNQFKAFKVSKFWRKIHSFAMLRQYQKLIFNIFTNILSVLHRARLWRCVWSFLISGITGWRANSERQFLSLAWLRYFG